MSPFLMVPSKIRPQACYERSLEVLTNFKKLDSAIFTKSSFMLGLGETHEEILETMKDFGGEVSMGELCILEKSNNRLISLANTAVWSIME